MRRLLAIAFIWICCTIAWVILGATLVSRTNDVGNALDGQVHALFGPPGRQAPPVGSYEIKEIVKETVTTSQNGALPVQQVVEREKLVEHPLILDGSAVEVEFDLQHRKKGLMWFPTYGVHFEGHYDFKNPSNDVQKTRLQFPLARGTASREEGMQASAARLDDFRITDSASHPVEYRVEGGEAVWETEFEPQACKHFNVAYRLPAHGRQR